MGTLAIPPTQFIPEGFRFQPTDKEIFDHFLRSRNKHENFDRVHDYSNYVPDIDVTTLEPWQLPATYKDILNYQKNENECWFFSARARNQTARRKTRSGKWSSTCADKKIMDGDKNQIMGIMKTFAFHYAEGSSYRRLNWILHEYHLSNLDEVLHPYEKTYFVLCRLNNNKDDRAKNKTVVEVGHSGLFGIDPQDVRQTNGEISSHARQRKRTIESIEEPFGPVNQQNIFTDLEQQMHPQDTFLSPHQPQIREISLNAPGFVESFGSNSSPLELSWSSSSGSRSSGRFDFNDYIQSNSPEDPSPPFYTDDQFQKLFQGVGASVPHGLSPFEFLLDQDVLSGNTSGLAQQGAIAYNQRAPSSKSLSGVVPAEEKEISAENRFARPQPSASLSPPVVLLPVIVADSKGFEASNSLASAKSFPKAEARSFKEQPSASNSHGKKISNVKIEENEKLAQETTEGLRLTLGSIFITQNQNPLSFPPSKYLVNIVVSLVVVFLICWQMLHL